jgi:hypothetical protein
VAAVEVTVAAAILLELGLPTVVLGSMAVVSIAIRRTGFASLGPQRVHRGWLIGGKMRLLAARVDAGASGGAHSDRESRQRSATDVSDIAEIQGNVGMLAGFVLLSWTSFDPVGSA